MRCVRSVQIVRVKKYQRNSRQKNGHRVNDLQKTSGTDVRQVPATIDKQLPNRNVDSLNPSTALLSRSIMKLSMKPQVVHVSKSQLGSSSREQYQQKSNDSSLQHSYSVPIHSDTLSHSQMRRSTASAIEPLRASESSSGTLSSIYPFQKVVPLNDFDSINTMILSTHQLDTNINSHKLRKLWFDHDTLQRLYYVRNEKQKEKNRRRRRRRRGLFGGCCPCCSPCCCLVTSLLISFLLVGLAVLIGLLIKMNQHPTTSTTRTTSTTSSSTSTTSETSTTLTTTTSVTTSITSTSTTVTTLSTTTESTSTVSIMTTTSQTTVPTTTSTVTTTIITTTSTVITTTIITTTTTATTVATVSIPLNSCTSSWKSVTVLYHCTSCSDMDPYQKYTYTYVAIANKTRISFAFREDSGCYALDDVSVTRTAAPGTELIGNVGFETGAYPTWSYCNPYSVSYGGSIKSNSASFSNMAYTYTSHSGSYFYVDCAVSNVDYLYQTFTTNIGDTYTISFWLYNHGDQTQPSDIDVWLST